MSDAGLDQWKRFRKYHCKVPSCGLSLDISRMQFDDAYMKEMEPRIQSAFEAMQALEKGSIANPDENRMVGHYWLRKPDLAPGDELVDAILEAKAKVTQFVNRIHAGELLAPSGTKYTDVLLVGIGGSALGPQLVADSLMHAHGSGTKRDKMRLHFFDNTDPDGCDRVIQSIGAKLKTTLVVVISKSGGTKETRNGMLEAKAAFERSGLEFSQQAVAVTGDGSNLFKYAKDSGFLETFPMWDWVGGRTSVMSAVGLLPAALQGVDIEAFLDGAAAMDEVTRQHVTKANPAALMALMWYTATNGKGDKDMVMLPYKDRLLLMSRYLQQLVMESIGKKLDLNGEAVYQGIAVYGNKGSTDQHAYVQQLRDGVNNFFITFITVLQDRPQTNAKKFSFEVEPGITSGDYLYGFWMGSREALSESERESMTLTLQKLNAHTLGAVIALYERAVGLYAHLVNINAYHQPGVEAGKKAAAEVLDLQGKVVTYLKSQNEAQAPEVIAEHMGIMEKTESIFHILEHLVANKRGVARTGRKYKSA